MEEYTTLAKHTQYVVTSRCYGMGEAVNELGKFLDEYIKAHDLRLEEFAKKADVGSATISRLIHQPNPPAPSATILLRLALATGQNPGDLLHLFLGWDRPKPARVGILNSLIEALPADQRAVVDRLVISLSKGQHEGDDTQ